MKPFYSLIAFAPLAVAVLFSTSAAAQDDPASYINTIIRVQNNVVQANLEYVQESVHNPDERAVAAKRNEVLKQLDKAIDEIGALPAYKGSKKMAEEALAVMQMYKESYTTDFDEASMLKSTSEESYEAMENYLKAQERGEKKLDQAGDKFRKAQEQFCKENELEMSDDDATAKTLSVITEVNEYSRKVFLIYFKASKANGAFVDALNEQKAVPMEKARQDLLNAATQGSASLRTVGKFKGDAVYYDACKKLLDFYHKKASGDYEKLVGIVKRKDALTQEDVEQYNEILGRINGESVGLVNALTEANSRLMKNHIPKN